MKAQAGLVWMMLRRSWAVAPIASIVITVTIVAQFGSTLAIATLQREILNQVEQPAMTAFVAVLVVGMGVAYAAAAAGNRIQNNLRSMVAERLNQELRTEVLRGATVTPRVDQFDRPDYLDHLHRVTSNTQRLAALPWDLISAAALSIALGGSLVVLAQVNPWLIGLAVVAIPPLLLGGLSRRQIRTAQDRAAGVERQESVLHGYVSNPETAKEIRVGESHHAIDTICTDLWTTVRRTVLAGHLRSLAITYGGWLVFVTGYLAAIGLTAWLVIVQRATLGDLALVITLGEQMRNQVQGFVFNLNTVGDGTHIARQYQWLRDQTPTEAVSGESIPTPSILRSGINLDRVSLTYPGQDIAAVDEISTHLPAGSVVALLGENGAGKTTLAKLLLGQYAPDEGTISIDGHPANLIDPHAWAAHTSGLVQDFAKLQGPIREAVSVGAATSLTNREIREAVDAAHAGAIVDDLPDGINTQLGLAFGSRDLSHGQWQRLALARGLTRPQPLLMVLDEPTSALDPQVEHQLFDAFFTRAAEIAHSHGGIALVVSHRLSTTSQADLILVMEHGRIVESGTHGTLMAAAGRYAELYTIQNHAYH
ncbi:MAG: ABC transporter ATP-binding protein/permease [Propionibacteriales bacterium]|nr:ABC transporter ATP-binding protein/permease [Propionibacteriales bacterium]